MKTFKKGQTVTRRGRGNATQFNIGELDIMGAYAYCYNEKTVFEIEGTLKLITFDHSKEVYGAYLLKKDGVSVGYVYNTYLREVEVSKVVSNNELLIKYTNLLDGVAKRIKANEEYQFGDPLRMHGKADALEMIINDLKVK
tara:strand:- start:432 stop:854 length:423 start_codon:yes stop_codon:yes gene_type:complete